MQLSVNEWHGHPPPGNCNEEECTGSDCRRTWKCWDLNTPDSLRGRLALPRTTNKQIKSKHTDIVDINPGCETLTCSAFNRWPSMTFMLDVSWFTYQYLLMQQRNTCTLHSVPPSPFKCYQTVAGGFDPAINNIDSNSGIRSIQLGWDWYLSHFVKKLKMIVMSRQKNALICFAYCAPLCFSIVLCCYLTQQQHIVSIIYSS